MLESFAKNATDSSLFMVRRINFFKYIFKREKKLKLNLNLELSDFESNRVSKNIQNSDLYQSLLLLLRGTPVLLYGDELKYNNKDKYMKWSTNLNCGFSKYRDSTVDELNSCDDNAKEAFAHGSGPTLASIYQTLIKLREEPSFSWGKTDLKTNNGVLFLQRDAPGFDAFLVAANLEQGNSRLIDFNEQFNGLPEESTVKYYHGEKTGDFQVGNTVSNSNIILAAQDILVLRYSLSPKQQKDSGSKSLH